MKNMSLIVNDVVCKTVCWWIANNETEEKLGQLYQKLMLIIYEW